MDNWDKVMSNLHGIRLYHSLKNHSLAVDAIDDVIALLKEQEPIEPIVERVNELDSLYRCGGCRAYVLFRKQKYCHACGRKVKWDD